MTVLRESPSELLVYQLACRQAEEKRVQLIKALKPALGRAIDIEGYPSFATVTTTLINSDTGKYSRRRGPVADKLTETSGEAARQPWVMAGATLLSIDDIDTTISVAPVLPEMVEENGKYPHRYVALEFPLNDILGIYIASEV